MCIRDRKFPLDDADFGKYSRCGCLFMHNECTMRRGSALKILMEKKLLGVAPKRWNSSSRLLADNVKEFIMFFSLTEDETCDWLGEKVNTPDL